MKILVKAVAPGSTPETVKCTSAADFLVYGITNGGAGYAIGVQSTGAQLGLDSPSFTVGGGAHDVITIIVAPSTTGFVTLQTEKGAKASIK
jgi:hypothetical protein